MVETLSLKEPHLLKIAQAVRVEIPSIVVFDYFRMILSRLTQSDILLQTEFLREYQPFKNPQELLVHPITPKALELQGTRICIASGSPRVGRIISHIRAEPYVATTSRVLKLLDLLPTNQLICEAMNYIASYDEPRRAWTTTGDGGLSEQKARLVLAGLYLIHPRADIGVVGRDFNIATNRGQFFDRASWTREGTDPWEQARSLYCAPYFFVTNATCVLKPSASVTSENIQELLKLKEFPIPSQICKKDTTTFVMLRIHPEWKEYVFEGILQLLEMYGNLPVSIKMEKRLTGYGSCLITGIVDWNRLTHYLQVWMPDDSAPILTSYQKAQENITKQTGQWVSLEDLPQPLLCFVLDEIVGISSFTIQELHL